MIAVREIERLSPGMAALVLMTVIAITPAPADAQIVNTLRRWSDVDPGWDGDIEARLALASGNTDYLEFSGGASLQLVTDRNRLRLLVNGSVRNANDEKVAESFLAHLRHNYRLTAAFSTLVFLQRQSNPFRRLSRRTLVGAGTRIDLIREDAWEGSLGISAMYEGEVLTDDPTGDVENEFRGSFFASAIGDVTDDLRVDFSTFYQPLFSELADTRLFVASSLRLDLVGELDLIVRFDLTHESRPPTDVEPTDIRFSTGLVLDF
ncbi:MAG: DUF481 domain-containing protein [Gemmatimonadota bacterium]|nr:DUF481 domain-containing protein [Gemmatimonadota bacterium]